MVKSMKKFSLIFLALILLPCLANAQDQVLQDLEKEYQGHQSWEIDFTQTSFVESLNQNLTKKGKIFGSRPDFLKIDYLTEPLKSYLYNGKKFWIVNHEIKEAQEFQDPGRVMSSEALSFLGGLNKISELFEVIEDLNEPETFLKIKDNTLKKIALLPKDEDSSILRLTLGIDAQKNVLKEAVLFNISGNVTHYVFEKFNFDKKLDPELFELPEKIKIKIVK